MADSGHGKTGLMSTLANAGHRVCLMNFEDGLSILGSYLNDVGMNFMHYMAINDDEQNRKSAWGRFVDVVTNGWKDEDEDLGKIRDWGPETTLVLDPLNYLGASALKVALSEKGKKLDAFPDLREWGESQRRLKYKLETLTSPIFKCNLIVTAHLRESTDDFGRITLSPATGTGSALSTDVGGMFNDVWTIDVNRKGERTIQTQSGGKLACLKCSAPNVLKANEVFDLAEIYKKVGRGKFE